SGSITRRLLAFAHRDELRAEAIDIPTLLNGLREILAHTLGPGIAIQLQLAPGELSAFADRDQLETVLVNLATNARDAMPAGGRLILSASTETVESERHWNGVAPGRYSRLTVTDTGAGMDAVTLARATEPFFTTKAPGHGTGLGLAMARSFAEQSLGGFHIASEPGRGTTVTLWLPAADVEVSLASPESDTRFTQLPGGTPRILLVDDEDLVRETLAEQLADHGYEVVQAKEGTTALDLLDSGESVNLLVSDLAMPGTDGVSLIKAVQLRRPRLPTILLTGFVGDAASAAATESMGGSFSLLRKPASGARVADRIATLLEAAAAS
ncbi:MAG: response regulator, partial [Acidisphaera sp.]|nr:response regulator [Acidisphaera sp.]